MWNRIRTGHGYDAHRFADGLLPDKPLILGGVQLPHDRSLIAHSDGDAVIHALYDAILGRWDSETSVGTFRIRIRPSAISTVASCCSVCAA